MTCLHHNLKLDSKRGQPLFFCWSCTMQADLCPNISYSYPLPFISLQDRIRKIMCSYSIQERLQENKAKLFDKLKKEDIINELCNRKIKFSRDSPLKYLQELTTNEVHGIQRLPALLYNFNHSLNHLNLTKFEIINNEPLHDISNYSKYLYEEVPYYLPI